MGVVYLRGFRALGSMLMTPEGSPINSPGSSPRLVEEMTRGKGGEMAIDPVGVAQGARVSNWHI